MTVSFGDGVLPHLDDLFDSIASKMIEVVIGIVTSVGYTRQSCPGAGVQPAPSGPAGTGRRWPSRH
jgi:hypothetical protein